VRVFIDLVAELGQIGLQIYFGNRCNRSGALNYYSIS